MPTIAELKAQLKSMNIKGVAKKNKAELMAMLEGSPVPARDRTPVAMSPRGASHLATAMNRLLGRGTGGAPPLSDALAKLREVEAATKGRNEARAFDYSNRLSHAKYTTKHEARLAEKISTKKFTSKEQYKQFYDILVSVANWKKPMKKLTAKEEKLRRVITYLVITNEEGEPMVPKKFTSFRNDFEAFLHGLKSIYDKYEDATSVSYPVALSESDWKKEGWNGEEGNGLRYCALLESDNLGHLFNMFSTSRGEDKQRTTAKSSNGWGPGHPGYFYGFGDKALDMSALLSGYE